VSVDWADGTGWTEGGVGWGGLIVCGLVLWAASGGVYAWGREVWPREMPEAVRFATAPAIAAAVTVGHKLVTSDFSPFLRAVALTAIVAALDAVALGPLVDGDHPLFRKPLGSWLSYAAIFCASWLAGVYAPV